MAYDERQSPRDAIRNWLHNINSNPMSIQINVESEQQDQIRRQKRHSPAREQEVKISFESTSQKPDRVRPKRKSHLERRSIKKSRAKLHQEQNTEIRSEPRPGDPGFAKILGLHAPFQDFEDNDDDLHRDRHTPVHQRKRTRKPSSTTSYLELALHSDFTDPGNGSQTPSERGEPRELPSRVEHDLEGLSKLSNRSSLARPPREKPSQSYERRPRHKTRGDRYELKEIRQDKKKQKTKNELVEKKSKKHKRKEKSGAALMHGFSARNVAHDRLTVRFFKAVRCALPDLAFSEVVFLKSSRARPEDPGEPINGQLPNKKKRRKCTKAADTEGEISRYFTSSKASNREPLRPSVQHPENQRRPQRYDTPSKFVDMPDKPFLGFGSSGAISLSPIKKVDSRTLKDLERGLTRSPKRATSYLSWSQSGSHSQGSRCNSPKIVPLETSRHSNGRRATPTSAKAERPKPANSTSKVQNTSWKHRDAATGISPPGTHLTNALPVGQSSSAPKNRFSDSGIHSEEYRQATKTRIEEERNLESREVLAAKGLTGTKASDQAVSKLQNPFRINTIQQFAKDKLTNETHERQVPGPPEQRYRTSALSHPLDPLDAALEDLLQIGTCQCTANTSEAEDLGLQKLRAQECRAYQHARRQPQVDPVPNPKATIAHRVPGRRGINEYDHHDDGSLTPRLKPWSPGRTTSRYNMSSPNGHNIVSYVPSQVLHPLRHRVSCRNAWNGYDTIYGPQQNTESPDWNVAQVCEAEHATRDNEGFMRPGSSGDIYANPHGPNTHSSGLEGRADDYGPTLYERRTPGQGKPAHAGKDALPEEKGTADDNQYSHYWDGVEEPQTTGHNYDIRYGDSPSGYHGGTLTENIQAEDESMLKTMMFPESLDEQPLVIDEAFARPYFSEMFNPLTGVHRTQETIERVPAGLEDPALSRFWTPHKLY